MALSGLERAEIMHRVRGMNDEELRHTLKYIPTQELLAEVGRREGIIIDKINDVCTLWDEMTVDKPIDEMDILEKEELIKRLRRCLYYGNE